ncbi:MAG: ATP-binding protein [Micavibrio sp.]
MTSAKTTAPTKSGIFSALMGGDKLRAEKARLEAFLAAFPGEYCGWAPDGTLAYSEGFGQLLGLDTIQNLTDIQNRLSPSDAMALEGLFTRLQDTGEMFCMNVRTADRSKSLKLCGTRGRDTEQSTMFHIIWLEDITTASTEARRNEEARTHAEQELARLQAAFDLLPVPVWMRDNKTDLIWCNRAYAATLETSSASVVADQRELSQSSKTVKKAAPAQRPLGRGLAQAALDTGTAQITQAHVVLAGSRRLLQVQETPLTGLAMTVGMAQDLTREEELETEQRRHGAANKELLEHLGSAIAIFNADQKIEFFNSAFAQLWQLEERWLNTGPKLGDIMEKLRETRRLPEQADFRKFKQVWLNMFTSLIAAHEDMMYLPDGRALRVLVVPHPLGGLMMTFEDVTSTLELESSYNTLIAVQKETLDNLAESVAVFGSDGRLKLWNPPFARLWGLHPEDLEGNPHITRLVDRMKHFFSDSGWPGQRETLIGLGIGRAEQAGRITRTDQTLIDYGTVPLPDGGVLVAQSDVTNTVRVETALRERNAALETAERLKLDFLANVSYQLRTPLNAIIGFSEILDKQYFGTINDKQREYTEGLREAGGHLVSLIDNILDLSTIEAGYMALDCVSLDVHTMLETMEEMVRDWAGTKKITVRLISTPEIGSVHADERRLKQVVINLIRNAIAFTPEGGTITLRAARTDGTLMISVVDTGPGIAPEDQVRLFEPFERAPLKVTDGKPDNRGAGLGLSLVRNIVGLHGGTVTLESAVGRGTTVHVHLPAA